MKKSNIVNYLIFIVGLLMMLPIVMINGIEFGVLLLTIILFVIWIKKKKFSVDKLFLFLLILASITTIILINSSLEYKWKYTGFINYIYFIFIFLLISLCKFVFEDKNSIKYFFKGVKAGCYIQICWAFLQYIFYNLLEIDINTVFFTNLFHFTDTASRFGLDGSINVSGFGWHPAQLVPIIVIAFILSNNMFFRFMLLIIALITKNTTCLVAILLCFMLNAFFYIKGKNKIVIKRNTVFVILTGILVFLVVLLFNDNILNSFLTPFNNMVDRFNMIFNNDITDMSTNFHFRYYSFLPTIVRDSKLINVMFGYGYECSGYLYTLHLNQYYNHYAWAVESDIVNLFLGRGIIWTLLFYYWLIDGLKKGKKISYRYPVYYLTMIICGILYNNQFLWVIAFEVVMYYCISNNINIFKLNDVMKTE